jgi:hypothetical protein
MAGAVGELYGAVLDGVLVAVVFRSTQAVVVEMEAGGRLLTKLPRLRLLRSSG